tara:strand:+ start:4254 stop:4943 length:690 start_codon:yes stop_codon:yes gene_type:complete
MLLKLTNQEKFNWTGGGNSPTKEKNMNKSTHKGHCQVCGSIQRLHNGTNKIYNHGFTRSGGFGYWTSAPCWGSNHQALEISCDIVEDTMARAYDVIAKIKDRVTAEQEETTHIKWYILGTDGKHNIKKYDGKVTDYNYEVKTYGNGSTIYTFNFLVTPYNGMDSVWKEFKNQSYGKEKFQKVWTEAECLQYFRDVEIKKLNAEIAEMYAYAEAQSQVLDSWVVKPLIKV